MKQGLKETRSEPRLDRTSTRGALCRVLPRIAALGIGLAVAFVCSACKASPPPPTVTQAAKEAPPQSDASADLAALKLSEACADAADKYWHVAGFDVRASKPGQSMGMSNHYNTRTKKCYMSVQVVSQLANGTTLMMESVMDPVDRVTVASLQMSARAGDKLKPDILGFAVDGDLKDETISPESLARFHRLMTE